MILFDFAILKYRTASRGTEDTVSLSLLKGTFQSHDTIGRLGHCDLCIFLKLWLFLEKGVSLAAV